jgi:predicted NAD/FAD-dependent oxidoreductase
MAECADPGPLMARAAGELLGIGDPVSVEIRHWPHAAPRPGHGGYARHGNVYLCGDAFGRPRVQTAWLSGRAAARAILQSTD